MCDQSNETKKLAYAVLGFLDEEFRKPTTSADSRESIEVAMQCLETAFGVTIRDACYQQPKSLREMYQTASCSSGSGNGPSFSLPPSFTNLMSGRPPATSPRTFPPVEIQLGDSYAAPPSPGAEIKKKADICKDSGNTFMKDGFYTEALEVYTEAIEMDGSNAVYFCNRSASYIKLNDLDKALRDVQIALQLDPGYARAYGRMGVIHSTLGNHMEAYSCYKKAHELDPSNESYENNLKVSTEIINNQGQGDSQGQQSGQATNQFANLFQNPALMTMATQMLQDPGMQNMMRSLMSNLQTNGAAGGGVGNAGGGFEQILQMGQAIAAQLSDAYSGDGSDVLSGRRPGDRSDQEPPQNDSYDL